jgi:hypothetical protein
MKNTGKNLAKDVHAGLRKLCQRGKNNISRVWG